MNFRTLSITIVALSLAFSAQSEYRAYLLRIVHVDTGRGRIVTSTLDQYQYPDYYPTSLRERVDLISHWYCPGRTSDFKPLCPDPRNSVPAEPGPPEAAAAGALR